METILPFSLYIRTKKKAQLVFRGIAASANRSLLKHSATSLCVGHASGRPGQQSHAWQCVLRKDNSIISHFSSGKTVLPDMFMGRGGNIVPAHGFLLGGLAQG